MNDIINEDTREKIISLLLSGSDPAEISKLFVHDSNLIPQIMASREFSERIREFLERDLQIAGLIALKNIKKIAADDSGSKATQLKANQWIAERAIDLNRLGVDSDSPSTMTQDQLARRLKDLQKEVINRAKPIDTGVIDVSHKTVNHNIDDML